MKKFLAVFLIALSSASMMVSGLADAKRVGGGSSIGRQSSAARYEPSRSANPGQQNSAVQQRQSQPAAPQPAGSRWGGILGGALAGLGLGMLFSHLGLGQGMGTMLMVLLLLGVVVMVVRMIAARRSQSPAMNGAGNLGGHASGGAGGFGKPADTFSSFPGAARQDQSGGFTPEIGSRLPGAGGMGTSFGSSSTQQASNFSIPADFDQEGFVRTAKTYFIRLQAAWDRSDINDIREFTSPEMFGELRLQLQERGSAANVTDVVSLEGQLLGIENLTDSYLASVRFSGLIKESPEQSAEPFAEIWNLSKPLNGSGGWVLAGIQQVQ